MIQPPKNEINFVSRNPYKYYTICILSLCTFGRAGCMFSDYYEIWRESMCIWMIEYFSLSLSVHLLLSHNCRVHNRVSHDKSTRKMMMVMMAQYLCIYSQKAKWTIQTETECTVFVVCSTKKHSHTNSSSSGADSSSSNNSNTNWKWMNEWTNAERGQCI